MAPVPVVSCTRAALYVFTEPPLGVALPRASTQKGEHPWTTNPGPAWRDRPRRFLIERAPMGRLLGSAPARFRSVRPAIPQWASTAQELEGRQMPSRICRGFQAWAEHRSMGLNFRGPITRSRLQAAGRANRLRASRQQMWNTAVASTVLPDTSRMCYWEARGNPQKSRDVTL
jgi:hypothetical protein